MLFRSRFVRDRHGFQAIYIQVLRTERAIEESEEEDWNISDQIHDGRLRGTSHLGSKQLRRLLELEREGDARFHNRIFHWGDVEYKTSVRNIVGVVAWIPASLKNDQEQNKVLLQKLKTTLSIQSLDEIDVVFIGEPFNEVKPEYD